MRKVSTPLLKDRFNAVTQRELIPARFGKVVSVQGYTIKAEGIKAAIASSCVIINSDHQHIQCEVIGFDHKHLYLMPFDQVYRVSPGDLVQVSAQTSSILVDDWMFEQVLDGMGSPIQPTLISGEERPIYGQERSLLKRAKVSEALDVGIRVINGLFTIGKGQRVGLFAGSGVGKSVLLSMICQYTNADVVVVALIGERSREIHEFAEKHLHQGKQIIIVGSPASDSPVRRIRGAKVATSIAEHYRDQGKDVLLLFDSLTRFAHAQREVGLAVGEPPTSKGYPPSVYSQINRLVERAGNSESDGSMTAIYTVLVEDEAMYDPVLETARSILDGHIMLSRKIADQGFYPAIDMESSISRLMNDVVSKEHTDMAQCLKKYYALYMNHIDMLTFGAYQKGSNPELDAAIAIYPKLMNYLTQKADERIMFDDALNAMQELLRGNA